jgi:PEP-CTERM motif-containing protein
MNRFTTLTLSAAAVMFLVSPLHAVTVIAWQGTTGNFTDPSYTDGVNSGLTPQPTDDVFIGNNGVVTLSGGTQIGTGRLRVGHNTSPPGLTGAATLTITGAGTKIELTQGAANPNGAVWIGQGNNGTLNIEDGGNLTANRLVVVGAGNNATPTGTLNIKTGGSLTVSDGNLSIGDRATTGNGVKGVVTLADATSAIAISGPGADLVLGNRVRNGTYTQTDGSVTINDSIEVGAMGGSSTGSTFTISGGTLSTGVGGTGNFKGGRGASVNPVANISGSAIVNVGNRFLMGGGIDTSVLPANSSATGVVTNQSGGTVNIDLDLRVADAFLSATSDATYNFSGGIINSTTGGIVGRQGIGKFIQTGGTANFNSTFSVTTALNVATQGTGELRVVGDDGTIAVAGDFSVKNTVDGVGKLAFEFEPGDLLSEISVTGAATFAAGASLTLDTTNASPTQTSYDLLTATTITDSGIAKSFPAGWDYRIVGGGNGQILQAFQNTVGLTGDFNSDGKVDAGDYATWRKNETANAALANDNAVGNQPARFDLWRANFGNPAAAGGGLGGAQVPEPAAIGLLLLGLIGFSASRNRNANNRAA